ncbi:hypothetical protein PANT_6c00002 [Moesziomyces antarcticus T-34]|uniref:Uncharacterized protein n=1 Tax=Pseudozyma antarctica (strain T-34) TaxID=1151754 RepID=M9LY59_PSEA3|nr:hypothetical protein PANT_6c00002 [Moesziomyces antarcticus T-34]
MSKKADEEARQPLLSNTDRDSQDPAEEQTHVPSGSTELTNKEEDRHWLEELVFKTRRRFFVSVCILLGSLYAVTAILTGRPPWAGSHLPWTRTPEPYRSYELEEATRRLQQQPFCLPPANRLGLADTQFVHDRSRDPNWLPWNRQTGALFDFLGREFDQLAGSKVRGSSQRYRESLHLSMSLSQGEPFYTRNVKAEANSRLLRPTVHHADNRTFRSLALGKAIRRLSVLASSAADRHVGPEELVQALRLRHSRIVTETKLSPASAPPREAILLETTFSDMLRFAQSIVALYHGESSAADSSLLSPHVIRNYLRRLEPTTDGTTSVTRSAFVAIRKSVVRRGGSALKGVGRHSAGGLRLQNRDRMLEIDVLTELRDEHELVITLDLERGLIVTSLAHLRESPGSKTQASHGQQQVHFGESSLWDWMNGSADNIFHGLDWQSDDRIITTLSGTYRYQRQDSIATQPDSGLGGIDWLEVDVTLDERSLWITRIELAPTKAGSPTVSILRKYNVGGTADFFGGWTCTTDYSKNDLADCYRPHMGEDDSKCVCTDSAAGTTSNYRVGLWPTSSVSRSGSYEIPRAAIRIDGSSYMDQGVGGCLSLWTPDAGQSVPEMHLLGYKLSFTEAQYDDKGKMLRQAGVKWLDVGIDMVRISSDQPQW